MVTINKKTVGDHYEYEVKCLSTDEKPEGLPNGTQCIEMNTGKVLMYDAENDQWLEL